MRREVKVSERGCWAVLEGATLPFPTSHTFTGSLAVPQTLQARGGVNDGRSLVEASDMCSLCKTEPLKSSFTNITGATH